MSKSPHPHGYLPFSSFPSPPQISSSTIPRSYNHSSDESETGSPSGTGPGPYGYASESHGNQSPQPQEDTPFVPRRGHRAQHQQGGTRPDVALSPDTQSYEYDYGGMQGPNPAGSYTHRDRGSYGSTYHQSPQSHGVYTGDRDQWRPSPGSASDSYYRQHASYSPEQSYHTGFSAGSPQSTYDLPRSLPSQGSPLPSGYHVPANVAIGHPPEVFEGSPDTEHYLRQQLNIPPFRAVNLWALPDPPPGQRPSQPLPVLIKLAIHGSPRRKLTLREIYIALEERFVWFRENREDKAWKGSIRHNLSLNKVFRNVQRPITEPGKGKYWVLDITGGEGYKRERKRRNKKTPSGDADDDDDDDDISEDGEGTGSSSAGSPASSGVSMQLPHSGARRARRTSPYGPSSSSTLSPPAGYGGLTPAVGGSQAYPAVDASSQMGYGQIGFGQPSFRQPAFGQPSLGTFVPPAPVQHGQRPGTSRSHTIPQANPRTYAPSSGSFGAMAPLQSVSAPGTVGPVSRSPAEQQQHQFSGYESGMSGYNADLSADGSSTQYSQYDPRMGMGRGNIDPSQHSGHGRGRTY